MKNTKKKLLEIIKQELNLYLQEQGTEYVIGSSMDPKDAERLKFLRDNAGKPIQYSQDDFRLLYKHGLSPYNPDAPSNVQSRLKQKIKRKAKAQAGKARKAPSVKTQQPPSQMRSIKVVDPVDPFMKAQPPKANPMGRPGALSKLGKILKKIAPPAMFAAVLLGANKAYGRGGFPEMFQYLGKELAKEGINALPVAGTAIGLYDITKDVFDEIISSLDKDHFQGAKNLAKVGMGAPFDKKRADAAGVSPDFVKRMATTLYDK